MTDDTGEAGRLTRTDGGTHRDDTAFGYVARVPVRYRDRDAEGHANNAVYATYMEEARIAYFRDVVGVDLAAEGRVLASLELDFRRRITGGEVSVAVRVADVGETSLELAYELRVGDDGGGQQDRTAVAATGRTVLVTVDADGDPRPVPKAWREGIAAHEE